MSKRLVRDAACDSHPTHKRIILTVGASNPTETRVGGQVGGALRCDSLSPLLQRLDSLAIIG